MYSRYSRVVVVVSILLYTASALAEQQHTAPNCVRNVARLRKAAYNATIWTVPQVTSSTLPAARVWLDSKERGLFGVTFNWITEVLVAKPPSDTTAWYFESYSKAYFDGPVPTSKKSLGQEILHYVVDQRVSVDPSQLRRLKAVSLRSLPRRNSAMTFPRAHDAFFSQFSFKLHLQKIVNDFAWKHGINNCTTLGVHYRGSDKIGRESHPVSHSKVFALILNFLRTYTYYDTVFITSDEEEFIDMAKKEIPPRLGRPLEVFALSDPTRMSQSTRAHGAHHQTAVSAKAKLEYAVINMLLLSKCAFLLKSPSALSAFAKIVSPDLPVSLIAKFRSTHPWFPDNQFKLYEFAHRSLPAPVNPKSHLPKPSTASPPTSSSFYTLIVYATSQFQWTIVIVGILIVAGLAMRAFRVRNLKFF